MAGSARRRLFFGWPASPSVSVLLTANEAISLELKRGEIVGLLGENGAGKTTLMNILFGHYVADEGTIEVGGKALPPGAPRAAIAAGIGMVHQHFTLADNLTVLDNIMLGTESLWRPRSDRQGARGAHPGVEQELRPGGRFRRHRRHRCRSASASAWRS